MHESEASDSLAVHGALGPYRATLPAAPGMYWVWQPVGCFPCHGQTHLVTVTEQQDNVLLVSVPGCTHLDVVPDIATGAALGASWFGAMWLGPITPPRVFQSAAGCGDSTSRFDRAWQALPLAWRAHPGIKALAHAAQLEIDAARGQAASKGCSHVLDGGMHEKQIAQ